MVAACRALEGEGRTDKLRDVSAFLRSSLARWSSSVLAIAVATTGVIPAAGAAEPAPIQKPTVRTTAPTTGTTEPAPTPSQPAAVTTEPAPTAAEPESPTKPAVDPIAEGQRLVAEGKPAEGAERLSSAYLMLPTDQRVNDAGRTAVVLACNAYEAAWQATADPAHLEANQVLLRAYIADLEAARAADQPTSPADEHEQALRERSAAIEAMLAEQRPAEPPPAPKLDPATAPPQQELTFPPPDPKLRRNALVLVGVGAGGALVGGIMVIAGALKATRAERDRDSLNAEAAGEARGDKTAGTVVATFGAILFSGSVMMLGTGSNRLSELRRELALTVRPTLGGMVLRGRF